MRLLFVGLFAAIALASSAAAQQTTVYSYDVHGRVTAVISDQTFINDTYAYDAADNRTRLSSLPGVPDPNFVDWPAEWSIATYLTPAPSYGVDLPGWWGNGNQVFYSTTGGSPPFAVLDVRSSPAPITPGVNYEMSLYAAQHRGQSFGLIEFYAADQTTLVSTTYLVGTGLDSGGADGNLANFNLLGGVFTAPAGAAYRRINMRLVASGGSDPYAFFSRPSSFNADAVQGVLNPRFQYQLNRWELAVANAGVHDTGVNITGFYGHGNDVLYSYMLGTPSGGLVDLRSEFIPSVAAERYEASVQTAEHRGVAKLILEFYAADKVTLLAFAAMPGTAKNNGGADGDLANFNQLGGFATAPAGTAYRRINLRLESNGGSDLYAFFTRPISLKATSSQTVLTPWTSLYSQG